MATMIDRAYEVFKAHIEKTIADAPDDQTDEQMDAAVREGLRLVVASLREPTEAMVDAGTEPATEDPYGAHVTWEKMIDAALAEG